MCSSDLGWGQDPSNKVTFLAAATTADHLLLQQIFGKSLGEGNSLSEQVRKEPSPGSLTARALSPNPNAARPADETQPESSRSQ